MRFSFFFVILSFSWVCLLKGKLFWFFTIMSHHRMRRLKKTKYNRNLSCHGVKLRYRWGHYRRILFAYFNWLQFVASPLGVPAGQRRGSTQADGAKAVHFVPSYKEKSIFEGKLYYMIEQTRKSIFKQIDNTKRECVVDLNSSDVLCLFFVLIFKLAVFQFVLLPVTEIRVFLNFGK